MFRSHGPHLETCHLVQAEWNMTVGTQDWAINLELTLALMPPSVGALVEASLRRPICLGAHGNLTAVSAETWTSPSSFSLECFLGTLTGNHVFPSSNIKYDSAGGKGGRTSKWHRDAVTLQGEGDAATLRVATLLRTTNAATLFSCRCFDAATLLRTPDPSEAEKLY